MKRLILYALLLPTLAMAQATIPFTPACIFNGDFVRCLRSQIDINSAASVLTGTEDPTVEATAAPQGSLYLRIGASGGKVYSKQDAGTTTNWTELGSGGSVSSVALSLPSIFSVSGSPVTGSGTLTGTLVGQIANSVWAGPASGPSAPPTFRLLVSDDIPALSAAKITSGQGTLSTSTSGVTIGTGTNALLTNATVNIATATGSQNGLLSSTDWTTFNNKVPATRTISTTSPLTGGGDLSANRTIAIPAADSATDGYLTSVDWTTFFQKQPAGAYITALTGDVTATGPGSVSASVVRLQGFNVASTTPTGGQYLVYNSTSTQWEPTSFGILSPANGGTGVANTNTLTWGAHNITFVTTATTSVTLPTTGTLITGSSIATLTNKTIVPANNTITLASANILVGNGSNVATAVSVTGDISINNTGVTSYSGTVPATKGGTGQTTYVTGDTLYASATNVLSKLAIGTAGQVLTVSGGIPVWQTPSSSTPTGDANTLAYFNSSGDLDSNTTAKFTDSTNSMAFGITASSGSISATSNGSLSFGFSTGSGSSVEAITNAGAVAHGTTSATGVIRSSAAGAVAQGAATVSGALIHASGIGAIAAGDAAVGTGDILSSGAGSFAGGAPGGSGNISASGIGAIATGQNNNTNITASGTGSQAMVGISGGAAATASGHGSQVRGSGNGGFTASGIGSAAIGSAENNRSISASADGAIAWGVTLNLTNGVDTQNLIASGMGSQALGGANQASGDWATAHGYGMTNSSYAALVIGRYGNTSGATPGSWVSTDPVFLIGNGTAINAAATAYQILKDGRVTQNSSGAFTANQTANALNNTSTSSTAAITKKGLDIQSTGTWNGSTAVNLGLNVNVTGGTSNYAATFLGGAVSIGTSAPLRTLVVDRGTGNNVYAQWTAGASTGQTADDGLLIGLTSSQKADIMMMENNSLSFGTFGSARAEFTGNGFFEFIPGTPDVSGCGSGATVAGANQVGRVTAGTGVGSCVIAFTGGTWSNPPVCVVRNNTTNQYLPDISEAVGSLTISTGVNDGDVVAWSCEGYQ